MGEWDNGKMNAETPNLGVCLACRQAGWQGVKGS